jgi:WD40 repeat protein
VRKEDEEVTCLAFSPDGNTLAAVHGLNDLDLCLWDVQVGKLQKQTPLPDKKVGYLGHTPDGSLYRIDVADKERVVRSVFTGEVVCRVESSEADLRVLALSADGKRLASADCNTVRLWDITTGKELHTSDPQPRANTIGMISFSDDGRFLIGTNSLDRRVSLWDAQAGKYIRGFGWEEPSCWESASLTLATLKEDGVLLVRDMGAEKILFQHKYPSKGIGSVPLVPLATSPGGRFVGVQPTKPEQLVPPVWELHVWDIKAQKETICRAPLDLGPEKKPLAYGATYFDVVPAAKLVVGAMFPVRRWGLQAMLPAGPTELGEMVLHFWDLESGKLKSTLRVHRIAAEQYLSSLILGGKYYRVVLNEAGKVRSYWWDIDKGMTVPGSERTHEVEPRVNAVSPDGKLEVLGRGGLENLRSVFLRDVESEKVIRTLRLPTRTSHWSVFSPDGQLLAASGEGGLYLYAVSSGELLGTLTDDRGSVGSPTFAPDSRRLATGAAGAYLVWDLAAFRKKLPTK